MRCGSGGRKAVAFQNLWEKVQITKGNIVSFLEQVCYNQEKCSIKRKATDEGIRRMGRYVKDVQLDKPIDVVSMVMDDFVYHNQFSRTDWNGEMVYYLKDRHGGDRYMKWSYAAGELHVEAWLKNPFGGEMDLDGVGGASRREYKKSMDELIRRLVNTGDQLSSGHVGSDPLHHDNSHHVGRHMSARMAGQATAGQRVTSQATAAPGASAGREGTGQVALFWAILAIMFAWSVPILGLIFAIVALRKQGESSRQVLVRWIAIIAILVAAGAMLYWIAAAAVVGFAGFWAY